MIVEGPQWQRRAWTIFAMVCIAGLVLAMLFPTRTGAATFPITTLADQNGQAVVVCNQSSPINITSATTTQLIATSGTSTVYVCGFTLTDQGTAPTIQFEYGTGGTCGTGTVLLSGAMQVVGYLATGSNGLATVFRAPAGNAICVVTTGTTPSIQGFVTFAQY